MKLTYEYLYEILTYDPLTGELRNKIDRGRRGKAGFLHTAQNSNGRIVLGIKGQQHQAHRIIWFLQTGEWPEEEIDHKNTIGNDNRWKNLREASRVENGANRNVTKQNALGIKGVRKRGSRYNALIAIGGKQVSLGNYDTPEEASAAFREAHKMVYGEFTRG